MIQVLFNGILNILMSLIQIIAIPFNTIIVSVFPNISTKVTEVANGISTLFTGMSWGIGVLPHTLLVTLLFILSVEIAKYSVYISTHIVTLVLDIIKRLKFW